MNRNARYSGNYIPTQTRLIQWVLLRLNDEIGVDGIFGPDTQSRVRVYQQAHHISADGIVGHDTWAYLHKELSYSSADRQHPNIFYYCITYDYGDGPQYEFCSYDSWAPYLWQVKMSYSNQTYTQVIQN